MCKSEVQLYSQIRTSYKFQYYERYENFDRFIATKLFENGIVSIEFATLRSTRIIPIASVLNVNKSYNTELLRSLIVRLFYRSVVYRKSVPVKEYPICIGHPLFTSNGTATRDSSFNDLSREIGFVELAAPGGIPVRAQISTVFSELRRNSTSQSNDKRVEPRRS